MRRVDHGIGQTDYTLGMVVGKLEGIERDIKYLREEVRQQGTDIKALQKSNSNFRWLERIGTVLGGIIGGVIGGRTTGI